MNLDNPKRCTDWIPERALFIFAHPDDIEFTAAGTAALWAAGGCEVTYLLLTDGNAGSHDPEMTAERLAEIRRKEQRAAAEVLGVTHCLFIGEQDGMLEPTLELRRKVVRVIRQYRPIAVVCGDPRLQFRSDYYVGHPDHRAAGTVAIEAVFPAAEMNLLYPDLLEEGLTGHKPNYLYITTWEDPNCYIEISQTIHLKIEALKQHRSQLGDWDPTERITERNAQNGAKVGLGPAESFRRITLKEWKPESDEEE